jgi:AraC family transcriptional activator of pobA
LFRGISDEYRQRRPGRELMLQSQINLLMVWISRKGHELSGAQSHANDRGREHLQAFLERLELHYREHWSIARYAEGLGLSAAHLNALCRRLGGQSALQLVNARLLLEAKRCLVYTHMTVNQVSDSLGFSEPAYFSRFFKRCSGQSPKEFRLAR